MDIFCSRCGTYLFSYQKDGPGILKRLYMDRIISSVTPIKEKSELRCKGCGELLGVPMIYEKEKRAAIRLFAGAIVKKIQKADI